MTSDVYLGLGSNVGNRLAYLEFAVDRLRCLGTGLEISGVYETEPVGDPNQPMFLNCVCRLKTLLSPKELFNETSNIELEAGRRRNRNGPRTLDIDLLMFGKTVVDSRSLRIPHPRMAERRFVLLPLTEIAPSLEHPQLGRSISDLLSDLDRFGCSKSVSRLDYEWNLVNC